MITRGPLKIIPLSAACLISLISTGCGMFDGYGRISRPEGYTQVTVSSAFSSDLAQQNRTLLIAELTGGIMIYFVGILGNPHSESVFIPNELSDIAVSVPNGPYHIYSVGFTGPSFGIDKYLTGSPSAKCGVGKIGTSREISLSGIDTTVSIELISTGCATIAGENTEHFFSAPDFISLAGQFVPITFVSCDPVSYDLVNSYSSICQTRPTGTNITNPSIPIRSILVQLAVFTKDPYKTQYLSENLALHPTAVSGCIPLTVTPGTQPSTTSGCVSPTQTLPEGTSYSSTPIPVGNLSSTFMAPVGIFAYSGCNCEPDTATRLYGSEFELRSAPVDGSRKMFLNSAHTQAKIFLRQPLVSDPVYQPGGGL